MKSGKTISERFPLLNQGAIAIHRRTVRHAVPVPDREFLESVFTASVATSRLSMPHAATTKGCLILCTVLGLTSNLSATPRMVSPAFRAATIRSSSWGAMRRGRPSFLPSSLALLSPAR